MKLRGLSDLIVFDVFPLLFEPKQKIILTHLLHLEKQTLPEKLPMIFTTLKLANQLKRYCEAKNHKCVNKSNIVVIQPYEFVDILLERRLTLQILFCTSEEDDSNVLVLIRQNGKLNFMYGGNYTDIRSAVLNDTFASWIANGVEKLYVNLKRMDENHLFNEIDQMQKVFLYIEEIMKCHQDSKIHIYVPLFGYEHFILRLAQRLPKRIKFSNLEKFYFNISFDDHHTATHFLNDNGTGEKITLFAGESTPCDANVNFKKNKIITINIFDDADNCKNFGIFNDCGYYELFYSPEPSPFQLKLLCMLVKPKRIFGIVDTFNNKSIVPKYLYELCEGAKENIAKKQEKREENLRDPIGASCSSSSQKPTVIIGRTVRNKNPNTSGPYLSDTDSDDDNS